MSAQLLEVLFNHDADDKRGSALSLRTNADLPLLLPEWQLQADGSVRRTQAAYATRTIVHSRLAVGARLRWLGEPREDVQVRALAMPALDGSRAPLFGELATRSVSFGAGGDSGHILFRPLGGWLTSAHVGVHRVIWRWQFRVGALQPWTDFAVSEHDVYTTLFPPAAPWRGAPFIDSNTALAWSEVLAIACQWAQGAATTVDAATRITARLFSLGGTRFEYGCAVFGREMYTNSVLAVFDCSAFVERIRGGEGAGPYVNCTDCACIVSTLANALGAQLWQSRMGEYVPAFMTRDIRTIGNGRWQSPCDLGLGFMFHEVAWSGDATQFDAVYDGSLLVNANFAPLGAIVPLLAANLSFGAAFGGLYRSMIAESQDQFVCRARPEERRCRALM